MTHDRNNPMGRYKEIEHGETEPGDMDSLHFAYDPSVMDEPYLQDHDVIQRYIRRELKPDELAAFEVMLIANPALIERIEAQRLINAAFKQELTAHRFQNALLMYLPILSRRLVPVAVTLVLGLYVGLKTIDQLKSVPATDPVVTASTLVLQGFRGQTRETVIELSALVAGRAQGSRVRLPLRIDVGPLLAADQRYQLQLTDQDSSLELANASSLSVDSEGWLEYSLELPATVRGHYQLKISRLGGNEQQEFLLYLR